MEKAKNDNFIPQLKEALVSAINNKYSSFYRDKYKNNSKEYLNVETLEDFQNIPVLTKDEILATDISKRMFVPEKQVVKYTFSSGTTNQLHPLAMPHTKPASYESARRERTLELANEGVRNYLFLLPIFHGSTNPVSTNSDGKIVSIVGDIHDLRKTVLLCQEIPIHGIFTTATALEKLIDELELSGFDYGAIRFISLGSESCPESKRAYFQTKFPNAEIETRYGSSEIDGARGYQCKYLYKKPPNYFHIPNNIYLEISDDGEIIHTDLLTDKAFPLIRYKTGDVGEIRNEPCACGEHSLLIFGGRNNHDFLKFSGVFLRSEMIDAALAPWEQYTKNIYQIHVYEKEIDGHLKSQLVLELNNAVSRDASKEMIKAVSDALLLRPNKNLSDLVKEESFLPLEIVISEKPMKPGEKLKKIVSHL